MKRNCEISGYGTKGEPVLIEMIRRRQAYLPPHADDQVKQQFAASSAWSGINLVATTLIQVVRSIIFARLLMPADFGLLNLANVLTQFILIFANFGFNSSVIFHRDLDHEDLSTCWWSNLAVDSLVAVVSCIVAYVSGHATGNPTMIWIVCLLALQFIISAIGSINGALLRRLFMFKEIALQQIAGAVSGMVAGVIFVAILGWGIYGLVAGMVVGNIVMTILNFWYLPWLPSAVFSRNRLRRHLGYGGWFLGVSVVTYVNGNLDRGVIGTKLDITQLGFYEYASNIPLTIANQLTNAINLVRFPAISSLQDDLTRLADLLRQVYRYNALIIYPLLCGIALVARDFVLAVYGAKWLPIVVPMQFFCLVGMVRVIVNPVYPLCQGLGLPRLPFKWSLIALPLNLAAVFLLIHWQGLTGAVAARLLVPLFITVTLGREIFSRVGFRFEWAAMALLPALVCCTAMSAVVLSVRWAMGDGIPSPLTRLLIQVAAGTTAYFTTLVFGFRGDWQRLSRIARGFLRRN
jgi:O-antigen/teichoic acid export membrane protein